MRAAVAVTGASGLIGAALVAELGRRGAAVRPMGRREKDAPFRLGEAVDPAALRGADALVHCAYDWSARTPDRMKSLNVEGSLALFAAAQAEGVKRLVFVSTVSAYDGCRSQYGRGKLEVERAARERGGVVARPGLVYAGGAGQGMYGALSRAVRLPVLPLFGGGGQPMVLAHVEDAAAALAELALAPGVPSGPVTLAHPVPLSFRRVLGLIAAREGRAPLLLPVPGGLAWAGLRMLEGLGLRPPFSSDSLLGLLYPNPDFYRPLPETPGLAFRDFPSWAGSTA